MEAEKEVDEEEEEWEEEEGNNGWDNGWIDDTSINQSHRGRLSHCTYNNYWSQVKTKAGFKVHLDKQYAGKTDGWMDGWMEGWMNGWMDG